MSEQQPITVAAFRRYLNEKKLMGSYCAESDTIYLPPRAICSKTHSTNLVWRELSGKGRLIAFTVIQIGLSRMEAAGYDRHHPYCTGIVELDEGPTISMFLLGVDPQQPESIAIGMPVEIDYVQIGQDEQLVLACRPANS